jgi:hypothetical protein
MSAIADAAVMLETALNTVEGARAYRDLGANLVCPALVLGPPALAWETGCNGPTSARFLIYAVVDSNERAVEKLWDLVGLVADAIDATEAVVISADPAVYRSGTTDLPCYEITTEAGLS